MIEIPTGRAEQLAAILMLEGSALWSSDGRQQSV
jgi:hypothetical protein